MGISFAPLDPGSSGFRDGLQFTEKLRVWSKDYERKSMVPDKWNNKLADETVAILVYNLPEWLKGLARKVVATLMDERLRKAMM